MADNTAEVRFGGDASGAKQAAQEAARAVKDSVGEMKSHFGLLGDSIGSLTSMFAGMAAVVAGGALFKDAVQETMSFTKEANGLARALGISATEASVLNIALGDIYSSAEEYQGAFMHFARQLRTNGDELKAMGVDVESLKNGTKSSNEVFREAIKIVSEYKPGLDQMQAAMTIGGRSVESLMKLQRLNNEVMEEARAKAESLNLTVGVNGVAAAREFKAAQNDVGDVMLGLKKAVGDAVIPVLTQLSQWFASIGPYAVSVMRVAIGALVAMFWGLKNAVEVTWQVIAGMIETLTVGLAAVGTGFYKVLTGDLQGGAAAFQAGTESIRQIWQKRTDAMVDSSREARDKIFNLFGKDTPMPDPKSGGKTFEPKQKGGDKSRMAEWEADLADQKVAYQKAHDLREMDKQDEIAYWRSILATKNTTAAESVAIRRKIAQTELEILKKQRHDEKALEEERIAQVKKLGELEIELAREELRVKKEMGLITAADELRGTIELENKKYQIQLQALQDKVRLYDLDKIAKQKTLDEIEVLEREHAKNVKKINDDVLIEQRKDALKWLEPITNAIDKSISGIIQGTLSLRKAMQNMLQSILAEYLSMLAKKAIQWIATEVIMTKATQAGVTARGAAETEGGAVGLASQMKNALKVIMNYAAEAFAGVWASLAGIPVVGPAMASVEAPAAMAAVMGATSMLSARNGFDIPAGVNPVVQTHEKEMILPREQADVIRGMASGGSAPVHIHARSDDDVVRIGDMKKLLTQMNRNFVTMRG